MTPMSIDFDLLFYTQYRCNSLIMNYLFEILKFDLL